MVTLIAECGNSHMGNFSTAKKMIDWARQSGADLVKFQAFEAKDIKGSMPDTFYQQCAFTEEEYIELIDHGKNAGIEVFFSIFSGRYNFLIDLQKNRRKIAGYQTIDLVHKGQYFDYPRAFVSFPESVLFHCAKMQNAIPLYVTPYLPDDPKLYLLDYMKTIRGKATGFGYSDHTIGIDACEIAVKQYGADVIEKHFTVDKNQRFEGFLFRDSIHGATPNEFYKLAKLIKG